MNELKRLLPYIKRYRRKIYLGFVFVTISNICSTIVPRIVGSAIDTLKSGNYTTGHILELIGIILLLTAGSGLFMFLTRQTIIVTSRLVEYDLREDFLYSIERQSMSFFYKNPTGSLMAHVTNDIAAAREFMGPAIMYGANTVTTFFFALYFMLSLYPMITFLSLLPLPLIAVTTYKIGQKVHVAFRNVQEQFANLTTQSQETFSGIRVVRSYVREDYESDRFRDMSEDYYKKNLRLARLQSFMMPLLMVLVGLSLIIVLGYGGLQVIKNQATLGQLAQFFIYLNLLIWPVAAIGWITNIVQRAAASAGRLGKIFDTVPEIIESDTSGPVEVKGRLELEDVSVKYGQDLPYVLKDINITIPEGTSLGIVGGVGSGKTTFINLITRMYDPTSGKILLDGRDIRQMPIMAIRDAVGVVPQEPFLFRGTLAENISYGNRDASPEQIVQAAKQADAHDFILRKPLAYETQLGEGGSGLSGGERQRL
jgi:ATP-binding cassette subfamily B protein